MGLFKKLFKKKEGGTKFGNLLRRAGDSVSGGIFSDLFPTPNISNKVLGGGKKPPTTPKKDVSFMEKMKMYWKQIAIGVVVLVTGIYFLTRPKRRSYKKRR